MKLPTQPTNGRTPARRTAATALTAAALLACVWPAASQAASNKISLDLGEVVDAGQSTAGNVWVNSASGSTLVKAVVVSNADDPEMTALRSAILAKVSVSCSSCRF